MLVYNEVLRRMEMGKKRKKNYSITVEVVCKVGRGENSYNASIQGMASDVGHVRTFPKGKWGAQDTTRGGQREAMRTFHHHLGVNLGVGHSSHPRVGLGWPRVSLG